MEQPLSLSAEHIRIEKVKLLQSIQPLLLDNLLVGQYTENSKNPGYLGEWVGGGVCGVGYLGEPLINNKSTITPHTLHPTHTTTPTPPTPPHHSPQDDDTISDKSTITETYAAAVLTINNPRWSGVPFILKAGKVTNNS